MANLRYTTLISYTKNLQWVPNSKFQNTTKSALGVTGVVLPSKKIRTSKKKQLLYPQLRKKPPQVKPPIGTLNLSSTLFEDSYVRTGQQNTIQPCPALE